MEVNANQPSAQRCPDWHASFSLSPVFRTCACAFGYTRTHTKTRDCKQDWKAVAFRKYANTPGVQKDSTSKWLLHYVSSSNDFADIFQQRSKPGVVLFNHQTMKTAVATLHTWRLTCMLVTTFSRWNKTTQVSNWFTGVMCMGRIHVVCSRLGNFWEKQGATSLSTAVTREHNIHWPFVKHELGIQQHLVHPVMNRFGHKHTISNA